MSDTETTPSDPRDNCPECGERGRFDLGTVQTPACRTMKRPAWCGDCQELQPVAVDSLGFWECQTCGCPTECGGCGHTMTDDHECDEVPA